MIIRELLIAELNPPLNATLVKDSSGLALISDFFKRVDVFGYDVETNVVNDFTERKVRTIQVGNKEEQFVIDLLHFAGSKQELVKQGGCKPPVWAQCVVDTLRPGLESGKHLKAGVNIQFDYEAAKWGFGLRPWNLYCSQIVEKLIYCGRVNFFQDDFWGMKDMLLRYFGLKLNKELQTSFDLETELTQDQVDYAALDTRLSQALMLAQRPTIEQAGLLKVVKLENNSIPAFGDMHLNGFYMDREDWMKNVYANREDLKDRVKELDKHFIPIVGTRDVPSVNLEELEKRWSNEKDKATRAIYLKEYRAGRSALTAWKKKSASWEGEAAINYGSPAQILAALRKVGYGDKKLPNTNDITLEVFSGDPIIKALQMYRECHKTDDSYGEDYPDKYIHKVTGRIHSKINQIGATTGRTSSASPNLQNIKKGSSWRACFKPRPGYKIVTVDMSGAELRIMAELSGEPAWLDAFHKNWDVHSMGAEMMYTDRWAAGADPGCPYVANHQKCVCKAGHKKLRANVKATNFKVAYGGADLTEDLKITKKESNEILSLWRKSFPTLATYLEQSGSKAEQTLEARTFSGRRRLFDKPTYGRAEELAKKRFEEDHRDPLLVNSHDVGRAYKSMWATINRAGKNTPIQGSNIDVAKVAIGCGFDDDGVGYMWHKLEPLYGAYLVNFVHDECVIEAPEAVAEEVKDFVCDCILRGGKEFMSKLVMDSEGSVADCWYKE